MQVRRATEEDRAWIAEAIMGAFASTRLVSHGRVHDNASMLDGFSLRLKNDAGTSNLYLLTYARAPVVVDQGDNDVQASAQKNGGIEILGPPPFSQVVAQA